MEIHPSSLLLRRNFYIANDYHTWEKNFFKFIPFSHHRRYHIQPFRTFHLFHLVAKIDSTTTFLPSPHQPWTCVKGRQRRIVQPIVYLGTSQLSARAAPKRLKRGAPREPRDTTRAIPRVRGPDRREKPQLFADGSPTTVFLQRLGS